MKKVLAALLCITTASQCFAGQTLSPPYTCTTTICQPGNPDTFETSREPQKQGPPGKRGGLGPKGDKGDPCHCDVADEEAMQSLRNEWRNTIKQYDEIIERLNRLEDLPENCSIRRQPRLTNLGGENFDNYDVVPIYPLKFIGDVTPWMVNCTKILSDGTDGWITIQRRQDGGTDFYRNWESCAKGFGNRHEEFWLGLRNIHKMTEKRSCKLKIDMKDYSGKKGLAEYETFKVSSEESLFRLTISGFSGNVEDHLAYHNGMAFSTLDRDNDDLSTAHCARQKTSPWWHHGCDYTNLNTLYHKTAPSRGEGVNWDGFASSMPFAEMKVFCA